MMGCPPSAQHAVSVVFQGAISHLDGNSIAYQEFLRCVLFLREHHPDIEIIVSTYYGAFVGAIESIVDRVVFIEDPGALPPIKRLDQKPNNVNRLIASSRNGISHASNPLIVKLRSDCVFFLKDIPAFYEEMQGSREDHYAIFSKKIITCSYLTVDPTSLEHLFFHISDWIQIGLKQDLQRFWEIPFHTVEDATYYEKTPYRKGSTYQEQQFMARYAVEQYVTIQGLKNFGWDVKLAYHNQSGKELEALFWNILFNNFVVASMSALCFVNNKYPQLEEARALQAYIMMPNLLERYEKLHHVGKLCRPPFKWCLFRYRIAFKGWRDRRRYSILRYMRAIKMYAKDLILSHSLLRVPARLCWRMLRRTPAHAPSIMVMPGNRIEWVDEAGNIVEVSSIPGFHIVIHGTNNVVRILTRGPLHNNSIFMDGENNYIEIGRNAHYIGNTTIFAGNRYHRRQLVIGDDAMLMGTRIFLEEDDGSISIGHHLTCSDEVLIQNSDGHVVFDPLTKQVVNRAKNGIEIGDNVWLGRRSTILKNVHIAEGCILGAGAVATKQYTVPHAAIAGNPAKIVKTNVHWTRDMFNQYKVKEN